MNIEQVLADLAEVKLSRECSDALISEGYNRDYVESCTYDEEVAYE